MACNCHKSSGGGYEGKVRPDDQCPACTKKHLILAQCAWGEFAHEDESRDYVAVHVRMAIEHCKRDHREFALRLRSLAQRIEGNEDTSRADIAERLAGAVAEAREIYYVAHPDARRNLDELASDDGRVDVILPLGKDSWHGEYGEARMLLRSVEACCRDVGRVIVAGVTTPRWLRNCVVIPVPDDLKTNKDGNMLTKVLTAAETCRSRRFCVVADDNAFLAPIELGRIPPIQGGATKRWFLEMPENKRNHWAQRMLLTYEYFSSWGMREDINYDAAHCPQTFVWRKIERAIRTIPYRDGLGLGMYACLHMAGGETEAEDWRGWVERAQNPDEAKRPWKAPMLSYTDEAWEGGIRARLEATYPQKSRYEEQ